MPIVRRITNAEPYSNTLAGRIHDTRESRGIRQSEFARLVGVSQTAVWNWEKNGMRPRPGMLSTIAKILGVSESFLKSGVESKTAGESKTVSAILESARNEVALATGLAPSQIKLKVEFVTS